MVFAIREQRIFYRTMLGVSAMTMQQLTGIRRVTYALAPPIQSRYLLTSKKGTESSSNPSTSPKASQLSCMSGLASLFYHLSTLNPHPPNRQSRSTPLCFSTGVVGMATGMCILAGTTSIPAFGRGVEFSGAGGDRSCGICLKLSQLLKSVNICTYR